MREAKRDRQVQRQVPNAWQVPIALEDIDDAGRHVDLVADADIRAAVAGMANLRDLPRLEASFDLTRYGASGLHVVGRVSATVGQNCVVTLEPLTNEVEEDVDLLFEPPRSVAGKADPSETSEAPPRRRTQAGDEPEPLIDGGVDLGGLVIEFLILGLDPYPRKPGAVFQPPQEVSPEAGPFAALAKLSKGGDGG
jgi:hypothetical protein